MKHIFIFFIKVYKKFISPLKPQCCRFYPSCSTYAVESFKKHGVIKGLILSVWRVIRCNPYNLGGIDYVPDKFKLVSFKGKNNSKS